MPIIRQDPKEEALPRQRSKSAPLQAWSSLHQGAVQRMMDAPQALSQGELLYLQRTVGNREVTQLLRNPAQQRTQTPPTGQRVPAIQRDPDDENEKGKTGTGTTTPPNNDTATNNDGIPTKNVYLVGHGIYDFTNGFFTLPPNTSVTFYTLHAKAMNNDDALRILRGEHTGAPERVVTGGESCPNMSLLTERDRLPEEGGMKAQELKAENEDNAKVARAKGHDMIQVDDTENLQDIIARHGPGYNYVWTCCYEYDMGGEGFHPTQTPLGTIGMNWFHTLDANKRDTIATRFKRSGPAGGWYEEKAFRFSHSDIEGRIEGGEVQSSGKMVALQIFRPSGTDKIKSRKELNTNKFKSYTVFIPNNILTSVYNPGYLPQQQRGNSMQLLLRTLAGKNIKIKRTKIIDKSMRLLLLQNPGDFSIDD